MEVQDKNNLYGELIKNLALVLSRYRLYPEKHPAAQLAVGNFSAAMEAVLQSEASVTLAIVEGRILADDLSMDGKRPGVADVVRECRRLQIEGLTFTRGIGDAELSSFFKLMAAPPRVLEGMGGFKAGFEQAGFEHIRIGSSLFRLVREGEVLASKQDIVREEKSGALPAGAPRKIQRMEEIIQHCLKGSEGEVDFDAERLSFEVEKKPEEVARLMLAAAPNPDDLRRILTGVAGFLERRLAGPFIQRGRDFSPAAARLAIEFRKAALGAEIPSRFGELAGELAPILEGAGDSIKLELAVKAFREGGADEKALAKIGVRFLRSKEARDRLLAPLRSRLGRLGISEKTFDETLANLEERRALRRARRADLSPEELQELHQLRDRIGREPGPAAQRGAVRLDEAQRRTLEAIGAEMRSRADPRAAVDALLSKVEAFSPPGAASTVRVIDRDSAEFEALGCHNLNGGKPNGWTSAHSLARSVMQVGTPLVVADLKSDSRAEDQEFVRKYGLVSYLGVPLVAKLDVGVLELFTKEEHQFSEEEVGLLATVADQAASALHYSQTSEEVKRVAEELAKSNRAREEFLGVISHELRTPLSAIMGYAGMIKEGVLGNLNPRQEEALEKVMTRSGELLGLINTMLEATSIEAGGVAVDIQEVSLTGLLQELKARYDAGVAKDIALVWEFPAESLALKTDRVKLKHILQNLIRNAIEFTDEGHITISARCLPESKKIQFKIADTGNGIPADFLPWIFDLFRQADSSGARTHGGLGLGLYIVKKYCEILGGTVDVESDHGSGSVFTVTLPVEAPARQPASAT